MSVRCFGVGRICFLWRATQGALPRGWQQLQATSSWCGVEGRGEHPGSRQGCPASQRLVAACRTDGEEGSDSTPPVPQLLNVRLCLTAPSADALRGATFPRGVPQAWSGVGGGLDVVGRCGRKLMNQKEAHDDNDPAPELSAHAAAARWVPVLDRVMREWSPLVPAGTRPLGAVVRADRVIRDSHPRASGLGGHMLPPFAYPLALGLGDMVGTCVPGRGPWVQDSVHPVARTEGLGAHTRRMAGGRRRWRLAMPVQVWRATELGAGEWRAAFKPVTMGPSPVLDRIGKDMVGQHAFELELKVVPVGLAGGSLQGLRNGTVPLRRSPRHKLEGAGDHQAEEPQRGDQAAACGSRGRGVGAVGWPMAGGQALRDWQMGIVGILPPPTDDPGRHAVCWDTTASR